MIKGYDVNQIELVRALSKELEEKKSLQPPVWSNFVKTGASKDRVPQESNWWYMRGASILRRLYMSPKPIGVNRLRKIYGTTERNRYSGKHFKQAGGAIIRKLLQQLESSELIKKVKVDNHYGRRITNKGVSLVDKVAKGISK